MYNRVILIGRLTRDPELNYTPSGIAVAKMAIAIDRPPSQTGEKETDFIDLVAWRQNAEFAANYLTKGRLIAVEGKLQIRKWTAQDGTPRRSAEVVCDQVRGLDRPKEGDEGGGGPRAEAPADDDGAAEAAPAAAPARPQAARSGAKRPAPAPSPFADDDDSDPFADQ